VVVKYCGRKGSKWKVHVIMPVDVIHVMALIKPRLVSNELKDLVEKKVLERVGTTGRGTYYVFRKKQRLSRMYHLIK